MLCQQSCDNHTARIWLILYVVSCVLLTQHNQENAPMSPEPFPICGWGLGTRLSVHSLVPRPHPQMGKDIRAFSWLCCVSSHVTTTRHAYGKRRTVLSLVPRPHPQMGKGLVTFERFLGCAVSAERTRLHTVQYVLCRMRAVWLSHDC